VDASGYFYACRSLLPVGMPSTEISARRVIHLRPRHVSASFPQLDIKLRLRVFFTVTLVNTFVPLPSQHKL